MKYMYAPLSIVFMFFSLSCMVPTSVSIKTQAEKIIDYQKELRRVCNQSIHDKEPRKAIKSQLNHILCLCNKAYAHADNQDFAHSLLKQAQELLDILKRNPLLKPRAAL